MNNAEVQCEVACYLFDENNIRYTPNEGINWFIKSEEHGYVFAWLFLFTLAKAFMVEVIRCSDRIHAISFGIFFLDTYGSEASREEVLQAFSS